MRILLSVAILLAAAPAFAIGDILTIPEPGVISLIGVGALAILIGRRGKK